MLTNAYSEYNIFIEINMKTYIHVIHISEHMRISVPGYSLVIANSVDIFGVLV